MKEKLSIKHKTFAQNLIKTRGHQTKAYMLTYPNASKVTAEKNSCKILAERPEIKQYLVEVLERKGMSVDMLVGKLKRLTNAKKSIVQASGEVIQVEDNGTRLAATTTGLKLHGALTTAVNINTDRRSININLNDRDTSELKSLTDKLEQLNHALNLDEGIQDGEITDADFSTTDETSKLD